MTLNPPVFRNYISLYYPRTVEVPSGWTLASPIFLKASPHTIFLRLTESEWSIFPAHHLSQLPSYEPLLQTLHFTSYHLLTAFPIVVNICLFLHFPEAQLLPGCKNWHNFAELKYNADNLRLAISFHPPSRPSQEASSLPAWNRGRLTSHQWIQTPLPVSLFLWSQGPSTPLKCPCWVKTSCLFLHCQICFAIIIFWNALSISDGWSLYVLKNNNNKHISYSIFFLNNLSWELFHVKVFNGYLLYHCIDINNLSNKSLLIDSLIISNALLIWKS